MKTLIKYVLLNQVRLTMNILDNMQINKIPVKQTGIFKDIVKDIKQNNPYVKPKYVNVNILQNPVFNLQVLKDMLMNINNLTDQQLYNLVMGSYDNILSDIFINSSPDLQQQYLNIFIHPRFLTILNQVMYKVQLSYDNRIYCNKIIYDYLTIGNGDQYTKDLLLALAKTVNRDIIPSLIGLGLSEDLATTLAISRFSSKKELVNIKRLNFVICTSSPEIMTEQMIVYIYEKLISNFTFLFEGTMFDLCDYNTVTEDFAEIYSMISLAILTILNNMPSDKIRAVLVAYTGDYNSIMNTNHCVRFSMQSLSMDYYRIIQVIEYLRTIENIYVP